MLPLLGHFILQPLDKTWPCTCAYTERSAAGFPLCTYLFVSLFTFCVYTARRCAAEATRVYGMLELSFLKGKALVLCGQSGRSQGRSQVSQPLLHDNQVVMKLMVKKGNQKDKKRHNQAPWSFYADINNQQSTFKVQSSKFKILPPRCQNRHHSRLPRSEKQKNKFVLILMHTLFFVSLAKKNIIQPASQAPHLPSIGNKHSAHCDDWIR